MKTFSVLVVLACHLVVVKVVQAEITNEIKVEDKLKTVDLLSKCAKAGGLTGVVNCAAQKALRTLRSISNHSSFEILPGITFINANPGQERKGKELLDEKLPSDPKEKTTKLIELFVDAATAFLSGKTLQIKFPEIPSQNVMRSFDEGRGKVKKLMGPLLFGLGAKMLTIVPIIMGAIAIAAAKAIVVGKLAFVVAAILFVQYFFSGSFRNPISIVPYYNNGFGGGYGGGGYGGGGYGGGGYGGGGYGGSYNPGYGTTNTLGGGGGSGQYPYARSIEDGEPQSEEKNAQELAYAQQKN